MTRLDPATLRRLCSAVAARRDATLRDPETGDVLLTATRRRLGVRAWQVCRIPDADRATAEVEDDWDAGHQVSTIPCTTFVVGRDAVAAFDRPIAVTRDVDGRPQEVVLPGPDRWWRGMWTALRTGATRVTPDEVAALVAQLDRAEPFGKEEEVQDHAA